MADILVGRLHKEKRFKSVLLTSNSFHQKHAWNQARHHRRVWPTNYELSPPKSTRTHHISHRESPMAYLIVGVCVKYGEINHVYFSFFLIFLIRQTYLRGIYQYHFNLETQLIPKFKSTGIFPLFVSLCLSVFACSRQTVCLWWRFFSDSFASYNNTPGGDHFYDWAV